ncbi:putative phosphatidate phosphatase [Leguminivora glycinivorella]|uniref:putative phosphatidate phosphatase n=1 Tax=Leguminivora glycinivorella TaxID=1035111 RepID=UPI00200DF693|nr:putative phosphatidate phosphatase [Leguminivora glycinivorella]
MWDKVMFYWSKTNRWHRVFLIFLLVELRLIPGGQVGFWCKDPALSHPFTGDTVNWKWLLVTTIFLPLVVMLLAERKYHKHEKSNGKSKSRALAWYKEYLFGLLINMTVVQTLKLVVGSPRPHFFDTCQPEEALSCQGSEYVQSYTCTKAVWQHQSDKSFPSGHTSLAIHAGIFIAYYMRRRAGDTRATWALQGLTLLTAAYCSLSRMSDHRHHWWDVLAGATLALPILLYTILFLCKNFECPEIGVDTDASSTDTSLSATANETDKSHGNGTVGHT